MMLLRVAVPLDSCGLASGSGFHHILMLKFQLTSRLERSLLFSFSFDSSIICFIISCGFGWPAGAAGWAPLAADAVAGELAGLCANDEDALNIANKIVMSEIDLFMPCIFAGGYLPVKHAALCISSRCRDEKQFDKSLSARRTMDAN